MFRDLFLAMTFLFIVMLSGPSVSASSPTNQCYSIPVATPFKKLNPIQNETWCYREHSESTTHIYRHTRNQESRAAFVIEKNQNKISLIHLYERESENKIAMQEASSFDELVPPYPVPVDLKNIKTSKIIKLSKHFPPSKIQQDDFDTIATKNRDKVHGFEVEIPKSEKASVSADKMPQDGYWWPERGMSILDPLRIYDRYVKGVTGEDPKSREWEKAHHSDGSLGWTGHCNGWVVASILYRFNEKTYYDKKTNTYIKPHHIDGMRAETSYCANYAFYGRRYYEGVGELKDINPVLFHKTLQYYIKHLNSPVAFDEFNNEIVNNLIISGYEFEVEQKDARKFQVTAKLRAHTYSEYFVHKARVAKSSIYQYKYNLFTDEEGKIIDGHWKIGKNPDFLWVPLSQEKCPGENQNMHHDWVDHIIENLEPVSHKSL
ncbi:MAG: hypothetical protein CME62_09370 [Halobacteriovoraceae bacterium]|nr:hypothetical protein [Halobacteriovoraceae bacterium]